MFGVWIVQVVVARAASNLRLFHSKDSFVYFRALLHTWKKFLLRHKESICRVCVVHSEEGACDTLQIQIRDPCGCSTHTRSRAATSASVRTAPCWQRSAGFTRTARCTRRGRDAGERKNEWTAIRSHRIRFRCRLQMQWISLFIW